MNDTLDQDSLNGTISIGGMKEDFKQFFKADPVSKAAKAFAKDLPDFYNSLADRIESARGMNLSTMFERDATRYSTDELGKPAKTPRGVLSAHWAQQYLDMGGDLAATFEGTIPREDLALIRMGQSAGAGALPSTLRDLSRISLLIRRAKGVFFGATIMGMLATFVVLACLIATPLFTVPKLKETFIVPAEYMPGIALKLYSFSGFVESYIILILLALVTVIYLVIWSLPNLTGKFRKKLDGFFIWRLYRDLQGALFLAVLSTMVKKRQNVSDNLVNSLSQMREGTTAWRRWHIEKMLDNIQNLAVTDSDNSSGIANAMNTGIIDRESFYYLMDVQEGQGLAIGLQKAGDRVEGPALNLVEKQAKWIARLLLVTSFILIFLWAGVHMRAISGLLTATKNYLSS